MLNPRITKRSFIAAIGVAASACTVYTDPGGSTVTGPNLGIVNYAPTITYADSGCFYDASVRDDIWYFEADVDDGDGPLDVVAVYADVYDGVTGAWVESFELLPTNNDYVWYSDFMASSTWLDCFYRGYEVDIVAYDAFEEFDVVTLYPATY